MVPRKMFPARPVLQYSVWQVTAIAVTCSILAVIFVPQPVRAAIDSTLGVRLFGADGTEATVTPRGALAVSGPDGESVHIAPWAPQTPKQYSGSIQGGTAILEYFESGERVGISSVTLTTKAGGGGGTVYLRTLSGFMGGDCADSGSEPRLEVFLREGTNHMTFPQPYLIGPPLGAWCLSLQGSADVGYLSYLVIAHPA